MNNNLDILNNLSDKEKEVALNILKEFSKDGVSQTYTDLLYKDYKEIPVDIETFITDDRYLGQSCKDAEGNIKVFPYWVEQLKKLFPNNLETSVNTFIASGAGGNLMANTDLITLGELSTFKQK